MMSLKGEQLKKILLDSQNYRLNSKLYGEFYIDSSDIEDSWIAPDFMTELGYAKDDMHDADFWSLLHLVDRKQLMKQLKGGAFMERSTVASLVRLKRKDKVYVQASLKIQLIKSSNSGEPEVFYGICTLLPEAKGQLPIERVSYSRMVLEAIPDMFFVINAQGLILDYKPGKSEESANLDADETIGLSINEVMPDFVVDQISKCIDLLESGNPASTFEYALDWDSGTEYYACHLSTLGEGVFLAIVQNVTHRKRKDEMLKEVFERRRIFIEQAPNAIAMLDKDLRYLAVSNQWIEDYNLQNVQILGVDHFSIFNNVDAKFKSLMHDALRGNGFKSNADPYLRNDGLEMIIKWEARPWYISNDDIGGIIILTEDITERSRIAHENARLSTLQQLLMGISTRFMNVTNKDFDSEVQHALALLGNDVSADRIYVFQYDWANHCSNNTHEWCAEGIEPQMDELQGLSFDFSLDWPEKHKKGEEIYIADSAALEEGPLKEILLPQDIKSLLTIPLLHQGDCLGFVGFDSVFKCSPFPEKERELLSLFADMLVNVMVRLKAQRELRNTKAQLEGILLEMNDVVWSLSLPSQETVFLSPSAEKLVGCPINLGEKNVFWWEEFIHPEDKFIFNNIMSDLSIEGKYAGQLRIIANDGEVKWVHSHGRVIRNSEGKAIRIDALVSDITAQKRNELKVNDLLNLANDQNDRFKNFAHIVTHNLRSNSTNIDILLKFWMEEEDPKIKMDFLNNLQHAVTCLNKNIEDLNEVVELTTNTDAALRPIGLAVAANASLGSLQAFQNSAGAQVEMEIGPEMKVLAVPAYLTSVLHNLINNGIKYRHPERKPVVHIRAEKEGDFCVLDIRDNGLGIDLKEHGSKLFGFLKTFHHHPEARGLGLFITKNQVIAMGGRIEVDSVPGEWTAFKVYLKVA